MGQSYLIVWSGPFVPGDKVSGCPLRGAASADHAGPWAGSRWSSIFHHSGTLFTPLGEMPFNAAWGQTRWADWLDLFTPYLMVLLAAWALAEAAAARRAWVIFAARAVTYVEGHGVHLSANSISNRHPSDLVHLWDETVGHYLLHAGLALMVVGLMLAIGRQPRFPPGLALPLAVLAGMTHVTTPSKAAPR